VEPYKTEPEEMEKIHQLVLQRMEKVQKKAKKRFDVGRRKTIYSPGEKILLYVPTRKPRRSEKLLSQFKGPYKVLARIYTNNYEIQDGRTKKKMLVPVERMKKFHTRDVSY
jgi:hypothetical protein